MLKSLLLHMSESPRLQRFATNASFSRKTARRFVAGETTSEGIQAVKDLNARKFSATLDNLGESVNTTEKATEASDEYLRAVDAIHESKVDCNVSLKLTQFGLVLDEDFCRQNVERVVQRAKQYNNFVRIDMEGSNVTDATIRVFRNLFDQYGNVGIVFQAYLFRTQKDIEETLQQKARIRLCKGAYKEPPDISFKNKSDTDSNYVKLMKILLKSGIYHGIATHDPNMINATKQFVTQEKIGHDEFEFQMLYGIRRDLQEQLIRDGYRVRIYVPYGAEWYSYLMRRMAERPANLMFVARNFFRG